MKYINVTISLIFLILSLFSTAMAGTDDNSCNNAFSFGIQLGAKKLDSDWPGPNHTDFGLTTTTPMKDCAGRFSLSWANDIFFASDSGDGYEYASYEYFWGIRQVKSTRKLQFYWGGGLALEYAYVDGRNTSEPLKGKDFGAGYWINAGFGYLANSKSSAPIMIGLSARYSDVELNGFGVNGGGSYLNISLVFLYE